MNIYIYGDSNTWGYIPSETFYTGDDSKTARYEKEQIWWSDLEKNHTVIVNGNNGRTTAYDNKFPGKNASKTIDSDLKEIKIKIDLLIIMLGTNDMKKEYQATEQEIADNLFKLIARIKKKLECKVLVICPPYIVSGTPKTTLCFEDPEKRIDRYHEILFRECREKGYHFTSFRGAEIGVDGEHLTLKGHEFAKKMLNNVISNIY